MQGNSIHVCTCIAYGIDFYYVKSVSKVELLSILMFYSRWERFLSSPYSLSCHYFVIEAMACTQEITPPAIVMQHADDGESSDFSDGNGPDVEATSPINC